MTRLIRVLLVAGSVIVVAAPAAQARTAPPRTVTLRAPVPAAGDFTIVTFEMSIGGEGRHHRKQPVHLELRNHPEPGVFALARLRPIPHHEGRFLGVLEVFHRITGHTAASPLGSSPAHAAGGTGDDEFLVRASNERVIKEAIKDNIEELAERHDLGPDEFCDPEYDEEYELGNWIISGAYILAGPVTDLPTNTTPSELAADAVSELCHEIYGHVPAFSGIAALQHYLGSTRMLSTAPPSSSTSPTLPSYPIGFSGQWTFVEANEVKLAASFTWSGVNPAFDTSYPVDAIKLTVPPLGTVPRYIDNYICPTQLPTATILSTTNSNDTLMCAGGTLPINQPFTLNVQTYPAPTSGMGASIIAQQGGNYLNPFSISGP